MPHSTFGTLLAPNGSTYSLTKVTNDTTKLSHWVIEMPPLGTEEYSSFTLALKAWRRLEAEQRSCGERLTKQVQR
jgi:hypothetical protein